MGIEVRATAEKTAQACVEAIRTLSKQCGIPQHLSELGLGREAIPVLVDTALKVERLLKNNVRPVTEEDARAIFDAIL
jgi:alcohol dehydrogenase class IV